MSDASAPARVRRRWSRLAGAVLAATVGLAPGGMASAAASPANTTPVRMAARAGFTSTNWAGYVSTSGPFSSVSATWVQPTGVCSSLSTYSSFWVGLDGDGSNSVEQTGSEVDCRSGTPRYSAWYEMYPSPAVTWFNRVKPGDVMRASVTADGIGHFALTLADATQGWSHSVLRTYLAGARHSAEIIAEAPSNGVGVLPLTNFGTVVFTSAEANGRPISLKSPAPITMASGGVLKAVPSALSGGTAFSVAWAHA